MSPYVHFSLSLSIYTTSRTWPCRYDRSVGPTYGPYTWCAWTAAETIAKVDADNNATQIGPDNVSHCDDAAV